MYDFFYSVLMKDEDQVQKEKGSYKFIVGSNFPINRKFGVFLDDDSSGWTDYVFIAIGILYIAHYVYDIKHQYLSLENGSIS
jgi:hypothetical protein